MSQRSRLGSLERKLSPAPFTGCESCGDPWVLGYWWGTATLPCPDCGCTMMRLMPYVRDDGLTSYRVEAFDYYAGCMRETEHKIQYGRAEALLRDAGYSEAPR